MQHISGGINKKALMFDQLHADLIGELYTLYETSRTPMEKTLLQCIKIFHLYTI